MIELHNDDCLEIMKNIPDNSVDCVITDCPYHIVSGGCSNDAVKIGRYTQCGGILNKQKDAHGNHYMTGTKHVSLCGMLNDFDPTTYTKQGKLFKHNEIKFGEWLPDVYRVLKEGTHCYIMINPRNYMELQQECEKVGFVFQNMLIWDKGNSTPNKFYLNSFEIILMLRKGRARNINNMGEKNILRVSNIIGNKKHPTEKPEKLMAIMVQNSTNEGETVLDPFMGVGSTGLACKHLNRNFIGVEIDEKYFKIAEDRIYGELL